MLKPFSMIFFILVMVWAGGILVTSDPRLRIERACVPVSYLDKAVVAVVQLVHEPFAMSTHRLMMRIEYGCQFTVWKTFYEGSATAGDSKKDTEADTPADGKKQGKSPAKSDDQQGRAAPAQAPAQAPSRPTKADSVVVPDGEQREFKRMPNYLEAE